MNIETLPDRALSIRQPWAWAILTAGKRIENRPRRFHYRGPICLHASLWNNKQETDDLAEYIYGLSGGEAIAPADLQRGGIIGTATIADCIDHSDDPWFFGPFGLVLEDVKPVPFVPVKGALGLFKWKNNLDRIAK